MQTHSFVSAFSNIFQEIADTPGMGELALKVFFQTPHRQMPNFSITGDVRDDLIAYITGLKRK